MAGRAVVVAGTVLGSSTIGGYEYIKQQVGAENLSRSIEFYQIAIPGYVNYRITDYRTRDMPQEMRDVEFEKLHKKYAPLALEVILKLRGFYIKVGQMVSTNIGDAFPDTWVRTMEVLQDNVPHKDADDVKKIVEKALGYPLNEIFDDFEDEPIGSASIGQVHRAALKSDAYEKLVGRTSGEHAARSPGSSWFPEATSGGRVVVKIQYPEVEGYFRGDVRTIKWFCNVAQPEHVPPLEEIEKQFMTEFDYCKEGENLDRVRSNLLRASRELPPVVVPHPVMSMCTKHVLVMEDLSPAVKLADGLRADSAKFARLKGMSEEEFKAQEEELDRRALREGRLRSGPSKEEMNHHISLIKKKIDLHNAQARIFNNTLGWIGFTPMDILQKKDLVPLNHAELVDSLIELHGHEILVDGEFQGDPHPGNILLLDRPDAPLGLIDYGQVKRISREDRLLFARLVVALAHDDKDRVVELMREMGYRTKYNDPDVHYSLAKIIFDEDDAALRNGKHVQLFLDELQAKDPVEEIAREFVMIGRVCIMLRGLGHVLHQHRSMAEQWLPIAEKVLEREEGKSQ